MKFSDLPKTWILDLDGTILEHNGHRNGENLLPGVQKFINNIPKSDFILILTARKKSFRKSTIEFLEKNKIRFDKIIFEIPVGERILINDIKPRENLITAYSFNVKRNEGLVNLGNLLNEESSN